MGSAQHHIVNSVFFCIALVGFALPTLAAPRYFITDLGVAEAPAGIEINDSGLIAITTHLPSAVAPNRAFKFEHGQLTPLPSLGGEWTYVASISENGVMAGTSTMTGLGHAVIYDEGILHDLGTRLPYGVTVAAINDAGIAVGETGDPAMGQALIIHGPNDFQEIGTLGGRFSSAADINNSGAVVGVSEVATGAYEAFVYKNNAMASIGTLGGYFSYATAVNEAGQIIGGASLPDGETHAFIYDKATGMRDLGTPGLGSTAFEINDHGVIIGDVEITAGTPRAAIFGGALGPLLLQDLIPASSGWSQLNTAFDINNAGQIVGAGIFNGADRAYLLTPTAVPEPTSIVLALLSLAGTLARRRLKRQLSLTNAKPRHPWRVCRWPRVRVC